MCLLGHAELGFGHRGDSSACSDPNLREERMTKLKGTAAKITHLEARADGDTRRKSGHALGAADSRCP